MAYTILQPSIETEASEGLENVSINPERRSEFARELTFETAVSMAKDAIEDAALSAKHKEKLLSILENTDSTQQDDIQRLAQSVNKLCSSSSCVAAQRLSREEIISSVLASVADGAKELRQGHMATCTATAAGKLFIAKEGIGAYAELMTNLVMDGRHDFGGDATRRIYLNEGGIRHEADKGEFEGADIAECVFRASVMQLSCEGLEIADPRMRFTYDDQSGLTYLFDQENRPVGSFSGMSRDGWLYSMEKMFGCGVEFLSTTNDLGGKQDSADILRELAQSKDGACIELSYAASGAHARHFCEFSHVEDGRVYFNNPHVHSERSFKKKSSTHQLESNGLESMTIEDFNQRLLSATLLRRGTEIGEFQQQNQAQQEWRSVESMTNWFLENPNSHVELQIKIAYLNEEFDKSSSSQGNEFENIDLGKKRTFYAMPTEIEDSLSNQALKAKQQNEERAKQRLVEESHFRKMVDNSLDRHAFSFTSE